MKTELQDDLRERWTDIDEGRAALAAARSELESRRGADDGSDLSRSHIGRALQRLSEACRFSGLMEDSLAYKDAALEIWRAQGKERAEFLVSLQRALVLAELAHADAEQTMAQLGEQLDASPALSPYYRDFWLEYDARRCLWCGDRDGARARLEQALAFRRENRAVRIVRWTEVALAQLG